MTKRNLAEKDRKVRKVLKEMNLPSIPTDPKTGKWVTSKIKVKKAIRRSVLDRRIFYLCPKCGKTLTFSKISHANKCQKCGERLNWDGLNGMQSVYILANDGNEAAFWAEKYKEITGNSYGIDIEKWRLGLRTFPILLGFPFLEGIEYGRFMRLAAKDAKVVKEF